MKTDRNSKKKDFPYFEWKPYDCRPSSCEVMCYMGDHDCAVVTVQEILVGWHGYQFVVVLVVEMDWVRLLQTQFLRL